MSVLWVIPAAVVGSVASVFAARGGSVVENARDLAAVARATLTRSDESAIALWERRNGSRPGSIVAKTPTPYPVASPSFFASYYELPSGQPLPVPLYPPSHKGQLAGIVELCNRHVGSMAASEVLATLASMEGGRTPVRGNLHNANPGNFNWNRERDGGAPAFFTMDSGSPAFRRSFGDDWNAGVNYWIDHILSLSHYRGAMDAARAGDLVGFARVLGAGGYARDYRDHPEYMLSRYLDRVRAGALSGHLIRQGRVAGYRMNGASVVRA